MSFLFPGVPQNGCIDLNSNDFAMFFCIALTPYSLVPKHSSCLRAP